MARRGLPYQARVDSLPIRSLHLNKRFSPKTPCCMPLCFSGGAHIFSTTQGGRFASRKELEAAGDYGNSREDLRRTQARKATNALAKSKVPSRTRCSITGSWLYPTGNSRGAVFSAPVPRTQSFGRDGGEYTKSTAQILGDSLMCPLAPRVHGLVWWGEGRSI